MGTIERGETRLGQSPNRATAHPIPRKTRFQPVPMSSFFSARQGDICQTNTGEFHCFQKKSSSDVGAFGDGGSVDGRLVPSSPQKKRYEEMTCQGAICSELLFPLLLLPLPHLQLGTPALYPSLGGSPSPPSYSSFARLREKGSEMQEGGGVAARGRWHVSMEFIEIGVSPRGRLFRIRQVQRRRRHTYDVFKYEKPTLVALTNLSHGEGRKICAPSPRSPFFAQGTHAKKKVRRNPLRSPLLLQL